MKFFQNRAVALLIALVVVAASTLLAGRANLSKACAAQEEAFYTAAEGKAPVYYIDQLISAAASLSNALEDAGRDDAAAELRSARRELVQAEEARDIPAMYEACEGLYAAVDALGGFSSGDKTTQALWDDSLTVISGAKRQLEQSTYNVYVTEYITAVYSRFPTSLFARLFGIDAPALFA